MMIRHASENDMELILMNDKWISREIALRKIQDGQIYVAFDKDVFVGWLRYGLFWDNSPFLNMLYLLEPYRGKGMGKALIEYWEREMKQKGYQLIFTSSAQTEYAQHFYIKIGDHAIGSFQLQNEPLEIIFAKEI